MLEARPPGRSAPRRHSRSAPGLTVPSRNDEHVGEPTPGAVDPLAYRAAIGRFATGVAIVTALHGERRLAMTANSLTSVSVEPRRILVCFMHDSGTGRAVRETRSFALNILDATHGPELARRCARKAELDEDQLADVPTSPGPRGLPLIDGCLEHLVCTVERTHVVGDHDVVIAAAKPAKQARTGSAPLVFYDGGFWHVADAEEAGGADAEEAGGAG